MKALAFLARSTFVMSSLLVGVGTAQAATPSEWKDWNGRSYRLEADGNLSCYSTDGINCYPNARPPNVSSADDRPVVCDINGYQSRGWCNDAYANLFAQWHNYLSLGHNALIAFNPAGYAMCDGEDNFCYGVLGPESNTPWEPGRVTPLVCGRPLPEPSNHGLAQSDPRHWCHVMEITGYQAIPPWAPRSAETRFTLPSWTSAESPAWIVKATLDATTSLAVRVPASVNGAAQPLLLQPFGRETFAGIGETEALSPKFSWGTGAQPLTMAIAVLPDHTVRFQRANGWLGTEILSPTFTVKQQKVRTVGPAGSTMTLYAVGVPEVGVFPGGTLAIKEIVAVRKRTPMPLPH